MPRIITSQIIPISVDMNFAAKMMYKDLGLVPFEVIAQDFVDVTIGARAPGAAVTP